MALKNDWKLNDTVMPEHMNEIADEVHKKIDTTGGTMTGDLVMDGTSEVKGNATTATTLQTPRTFEINGSAKQFDGSQNVAWTAADIGLTGYLPLTGGTMTGDLIVTGALTNDGNQVWHGGNFDPNSKFDKTGGTVTGNIVMKENIMFDNNKGISVKDTSGNDKWVLFIDDNNQTVVGDNSLDTAIKGSLIYMDGTVSFRGVAQFQNNAPIRGQATDGRFAELIYMSPQNQVRVGSYNEPFPLFLNSSEDIKFENTTLRQTYTMWHDNNLKIEEGNWTPILQTTGGIPIPSQVVQNGKYYRVGNKVFVTGNIQSTNTAGMSGQIVISGLPFISSALSYSSVTFGWTTGFITNGLRFSGYTQPNSNYIVLAYNDMTTGAFYTINQANLSGNNQCDIAFSAVYLID